MIALKTIAFLLLVFRLGRNFPCEAPCFLAEKRCNQEYLPIDHVMALTKSNAKDVRWTVTGKFNNQTWNRLWTELEVTQHRWDEWQAARGALLVIPNLPTLPLLAHIDEGSISLDPAALQHECKSVLERVTDLEVRNMLEDLLRTADSAVGDNATIDVYPSTGESVGDTFSSENASTQ